MRFLGIMGRKNEVCVGRCMCSRNRDGKKGNLKKNETCAHFAAVLGTLSRNFEKKGKWYFFRLRGAIGCKKVKKKKKNFLWDVFPYGFLISGDKNDGKSK